MEKENLQVTKCVICQKEFKSKLELFGHQYLEHDQEEISTSEAIQIYDSE